MRSIPGYTKEDAERIFLATKGAGTEVLRLKGGAGRAVGIAIMTVVHALAYDRGTILPVSSMQTGLLGISDISLSLPTKLGRQGIMQVVEPEISFEEHEALLSSAAGLKEVLGHVRVGASPA